MLVTCQKKKWRLSCPVWRLSMDYPKKHLRLKDVPVLLLWNAAVLHILEKVARYSQTFMQAQILLFRCHELEKKNSKLNVKMNSEVICCNYLSQWWDEFEFDMTWLLIQIDFEDFISLAESMYLTKSFLKFLLLSFSYFSSI